MAASNIPLGKPLTDDILICPLCLHQLETPVTLQQCLHTYCKECLDELPQKTEDNVFGWACPRCNQFSCSADVKQNDFILKMLQTKITDVKDPLECKQCHGNTEVIWQCNDCKIELCSSCRILHLNIPVLKNHAITHLDASSTTSGTIIDELLFCSCHKEKLLELNCRVCEVPMCLLCKVEDHDTHTTETVSNALGRLVPEVDQRSETIAERVEHLEAKVKAIRRKMEDAKMSYAVIREKVHERIEYLITQLKEIEIEQEQILVKEEMEALKIMEESKIELEAKVEETKQLLNMTSFTTRSARNTSLLQQLQQGLLQKVRTSSEVQSEPLMVDIPCYALAGTLKEEQSRRELRNIYGELRRQDLKYKTSKDGQLLDNHYICYNISTYMNRMSNKPNETVDLPSHCDRISFIDNSIYVPLHGEVRLYDLEGKLTTQIQVPFYAVIIKSLPNHQIAVGSLSGLYLYDSFKPDVDAVQLEAGKYSDIDIYGDIFYALKYDTSEILPFKLAGSSKCKENQTSVKKIPWIKECTVELACISKPHDGNTFCRTEHTFIVSSLEDRCLFLCDIKGTVLRRCLCGNQMLLCGVDVNENVVLVNYQKNTIFSYNVKEDAEKNRCLSPLPGHPCDILLDNARNMWVLVEQGEDHKLLKFSL